MISVIPDGPIAPFIYLIVIIHLSFFNNKSRKCEIDQEVDLDNKEIKIMECKL